jgi:hypothetical protein
MGGNTASRLYQEAIDNGCTEIHITPEILNPISYAVCIAIFCVLPLLLTAISWHVTNVYYLLLYFWYVFSLIMYTIHDIQFYHRRSDFEIFGRCLLNKEYSEHFMLKFFFLILIAQKIVSYLYSIGLDTIGRCVRIVHYLLLLGFFPVFCARVAISLASFFWVGWPYFWHFVPTGVGGFCAYLIFFSREMNYLRATENVGSATTIEQLREAQEEWRKIDEEIERANNVPLRQAQPQNAPTVQIFHMVPIVTGAIVEIPQHNIIINPNFVLPPQQTSHQQHVVGFQQLAPAPPPPPILTNARQDNDDAQQQQPPQEQAAVLPLEQNHTARSDQILEPVPELQQQAPPQQQQDEQLPSFERRGINEETNRQHWIRHELWSSLLLKLFWIAAFYIFSYCLVAGWDWRYNKYKDISYRDSFTAFNVKRPDVDEMFRNFTNLNTDQQFYIAALFG